MSEVYSKEGDNLKIDRTTSKADVLNYDEILKKISVYEDRLAYWQAVKVEADNLGVKAVAKGL